MNDIKVCGKCKVEKEVSLFRKRKSRKNGLYSQCKECEKKYHKELYQKNKERMDSRSKEYYEKNKEKMSLYNKVRQQKNKLKTNAYYRDRRKTDPNFKLRANLRTRIYQALKGIDKSSSTVKLMGIPIEEFKLRIESQFTEGMTWENYGIYGWHIDHIRPCASFDLTDQEQQKVCFHYSNLQPLWARDNLSKSDSYCEQTP